MVSDSFFSYTWDHLKWVYFIGYIGSGISFSERMSLTLYIFPGQMIWLPVNNVHNHIRNLSFFCHFIHCYGIFAPAHNSVCSTASWLQSTRWSHSKWMFLQNYTITKMTKFSLIIFVLIHYHWLTLINHKLIANYIHSI